MKHPAKILIITVILGFLVYMALAIIQKLSEKEELRERISEIPSFRLERLSNGFFTEKELPISQPVIFLLINSTCDFCRLEAKAIKDRIAEFKDVQLVFVSTEEKIDIENFAKEYGLYESDNVVFLQDPSMEFSGVFGISTVPATFVYNQDGELVRQFNGAVKVDLMLEALKE